MPAVEIFFHRR